MLAMCSPASALLFGCAHNLTLPIRKVFFFFLFSFCVCSAGGISFASSGAQADYPTKGMKRMKSDMVQKMLCVLFTALVVFCAAMTGTHAWRDVSQHRSNDFYGGATTGPDGSTSEPPTTTEPDTTTELSTTIPQLTTTTTTQTTVTTTGTQATTTIAPHIFSTGAHTTTSAHITTARPTNPPGPQTGDASKIWLWTLLTMLSALGLRWVLLWRQKNKRTEKKGDDCCEKK